MVTVYDCVERHNPVALPLIVPGVAGVFNASALERVPDVPQALEAEMERLPPV